MGVVVKGELIGSIGTLLVCFLCVFFFKQGKNNSGLAQDALIRVIAPPTGNRKSVLCESHDIYLMVSTVDREQHNAF